MHLSEKQKSGKKNISQPRNKTWHSVTMMFSSSDCRPYAYTCTVYVNVAFPLKFHSEAAGWSHFKEYISKLHS